MFRPTLRHLQANVLHKIRVNYRYILNLYVHRLKSQPILKSNVKYMSSGDFPLREVGPAFPTGTGNKGSVTPIAGRIRQHFAGSSASQTGTNDDLC